MITFHHCGRYVQRCLLALTTILAGLPVGSVAAGLSFSDAVTIAEERASELVGRRNALQAAESARIAADRLPDPKLLLGIENVPVEGVDRWTLDRDFMTMRRIGLMQEFPNGPKRDARADMANAAIEKERAMLAADRLMVRREAAMAWLERYFLERRIALIDDLERENKLLLAAAQAQLGAGQGMAVDSTTARQEQAMLADRRDDLSRQLARSKSMLRRWVGTIADDELAGDPPAFTIDAEHVREVLHRHAELAVYEPMLAEAAAQTREANAMRRPDWAVELAYQKRGDMFGDMASLQFTVDLPIFSGSRQNPRIAAKRQEEERIAAERESARRKHAEMIEGWLADYAALSQKAARVQNTWLPLAQEKADLMQASYRAGKSTLAQTLAARRELIETRFRSVELDAELAAVAARLAYLYEENKP